MPADGIPKRWIKGDRLLHDKLNDAPDLLEKLQRRVEQLEGEAKQVQLPPPLLWWAKVVTANVATSPPVQLVKLLDPSGGILSSNIAVVTDGEKAVDDEFYVFRPANGVLTTADATTYEDQNVEWREHLAMLPQLHVTSAATGGGQYIAREVTPPTSWDSDADLVAAMFGTDGDTDVVLVNEQEVDQDPPSHWLTDSANVKQKYFVPARRGGRDAAGRQVYYGNFFWSDICDDEGATGPTIYEQDDAPSSPNVGDFWVDTDS